MYIIGVVGSLAASIGCGLSRRYEILITLRALNGLFAGAAIGLGTVVCSDIFYAHQRGLYLGLYMVVHMIGGQLAPTAGGFIYRKVNWHWCFYIPAIMAAAFLIPLILAFPETLYSRSVESLKRPQMSEYQKERLRKKRSESRKMRFSNFTRQFKMLRYPSILLPAIFYAVASGYGSMVFVISSAILFRKTYHFHTWQIGMLLGLPLMIGSVIGEAGAGGFSDWVIRRRAVDRGGKRIAEDRLYAMIPGVILLPLGLLVEAYSIHNRTHWVGPGLGISIASAGLQIVTTVTYAYTADVGSDSGSCDNDFTDNRIVLQPPSGRDCLDTQLRPSNLRLLCWLLRNSVCVEVWPANRLDRLRHCRNPLLPTHHTADDQGCGMA